MFLRIIKNINKQKASVDLVYYTVCDKHWLMEVFEYCLFPLLRLVCEVGWGWEGLSSLFLINNRVINQRGRVIQKHKHTGAEWSLNMEPDTLSPYNSVISTVCVCVTLFITCVHVELGSVGVCSQSICVFLRVRETANWNQFVLSAVWTPLCPSSWWVCVSVCHLVTLFLQCWWVPLVTVCGSFWSECVWCVCLCVWWVNRKDRAITSSLVALKRTPAVVDVDSIKFQWI